MCSAQAQMQQGLYAYSNEVIELKFVLSEDGWEIVWAEVSDKAASSIARGKGEWFSVNSRTVDPDYNGPGGWYQFEAGGLNYEFEEPKGKSLKLTRSRNGKVQKVFNLKKVENQMANKARSDTEHHKALYKQINDNLNSFNKQSITHKLNGVSYRLDGWSKNGEAIKITAKAQKPDDHMGTEEYYIENSRPLFVFRVSDMLDSETGEIMVRKAENRFYFRDGCLFKWLNWDKSEMSPDEEIFGDEGEFLSTNCRAFINAFDSSNK
jgi:hypothetical protein